MILDNKKGVRLKNNIRRICCYCHKRRYLYKMTKCYYPLLGKVHYACTNCVDNIGVELCVTEDLFKYKDKKIVISR